MNEDVPSAVDGAADGVDRTDMSSGTQTLRARTVARGTIWQETYIRGFPPRSSAADRDGKSLDADDLASNPMEDLLAALGNCLTRSIHANALAQEIPVKHVETIVEASMNRAGRWAGIGAPRPVGFEMIKVFVKIEADAPREVLDNLVRTTALWSPVANTLFSPAHLDVSLVDDD